MSQFLASFPDRQFSRHVSFGAGDDFGAGGNIPSLPPAKETQVFASKVVAGIPSSQSKKRNFELLSAGANPLSTDGQDDQSPLKKARKEVPSAKSGVDLDGDTEMGKQDDRGVSQFLKPSFGGPELSSAHE